MNAGENVEAHGRITAQIKSKLLLRRDEVRHDGIEKQRGVPSCWSYIIGEVLPIVSGDRGGRSFGALARWTELALGYAPSIMTMRIRRNFVPGNQP